MRDGATCFHGNRFDKLYVVSNVQFQMSASPTFFWRWDENENIFWDFAIFNSITFTWNRWVLIPYCWWWTFSWFGNICIKSENAMFSQTSNRPNNFININIGKSMWSQRNAYLLKVLTHKGRISCRPSWK